MSIGPSFLVFIVIGIVSELTFRSDTIRHNLWRFHANQKF